MLVLLNILGALCFFVTRFDPNLNEGDADKVFGFLSDHNKKVDVESKGDIALMTYNLERKDQSQKDGQVDGIKVLLDTSHVSVMALQEITSSQITALKEAIIPHYNIVEDTTSAVLDLTTAGKTYLPIVYDSESFEFINSGVFITNDKNLKNTYASWAKLKSKLLNKTFIFVNMNLYSTKSKVDSIEMANILRDLEQAGEKKQNITVLMGTINSMSDEAKMTIKKALYNISEPKNPNMMRNTLNSYNDAVNNIQRDFLLVVPSDKDKLEAIYNGILSKFDYGIRFPVHAITNVVKNPKDDATHQSLKN